MANHRMDVIKRDDSDFELLFEDVDGVAVDLTGATVFFTVKKNKLDTDAQAVIAKEITSFEEPTDGIAILNLTKEDTDILPRSYFFDVQLKDSADKIISSQVGRFIVSQDITIRTS